MGTAPFTRFVRAGVSCLILGVLAAACGTSAGTTTDVPTTSCPPLVTDTLVPAATPPDGAAACPAGDCNYQTQDGCSDKQACIPIFTATDPAVNPGCVMAGGRKSGQGCTLSTNEHPVPPLAEQCERGSFCASDAHCHKLCCGRDWTGCDAGESCITELDVRAGGQVTSAGVSLCMPVNDCDALDPFHCADSKRECKIVDPVGDVACMPKSSAKLGDSCAPPAVCAGGLSCVGGVCIRLCRFTDCGDPSCPEAEGSCVHFLRDPDGVGECTVGR